MNSTINGNSTLSNSTASNSTTSYLDNQLTFTYDEGINYFGGLNVNCTKDEECPTHTTCGIKDSYKFYHSEDCSGQCIAQFYCIKDKSICSFKNGYEGVKYTAYISQSNKWFGLNNYEKCRYDGECISGRCRDKNFFGIGHCYEPSDSDNAAAAIAFGVFIVIMILIIAGICLCTCVVACLQSADNSRRRKKGLEENHSKAFKPLAICLIVAISILMLYTIINSIDNELNKQPL